MKSKIGAAAATSLAGLAMMGAGSYALFTAQAQSNPQTFGAGVVDIATTGQGFQTFSNNHTIDFYNMVPGDYVGSYVVVQNTGSVNEVVDINTQAHGPIFWDDGLNNGKETTLNGYKKGSLPSSASPVASTAQSTYADFWQPRLLSNGPQVMGGDWESVDYPDTKQNSQYEHDNHPASYTLNYQIYNEQPTVTMNATNSSTQAPTFTVTGSNGQTLTPASDIIANTITYTYNQAGYNPATGQDYPQQTGTFMNGQTPFSGSSDVQGIVLQPGQYMVVEYTGQLPIHAGNDYQDAWGTAQVVFNAAQWENNHNDDQNPILTSPTSPTQNTSSTGTTSGSGSVPTSPSGNGPTSGTGNPGVPSSSPSGNGPTSGTGTPGVPSSSPSGNDSTTLSPNPPINFIS
ncbi:TasA family protein [Alicyclobacillus sp. TC]|uniref:TasA family protein n=1 Tax=Alicyclobacillus sp. TC TaxID=2606450 RepID=UPI001932BEC2|nr:TasA family protein [Alicyclobacillus sp. TC]